jgi:hypothetical protein
MRSRDVQMGRLDASSVPPGTRRQRSRAIDSDRRAGRPAHSRTRRGPNNEGRSRSWCFSRWKFRTGGQPRSCRRRSSLHSSTPPPKTPPPKPGSGVNLQAERAEATGFEPAVSALTGLHVRPLHHASVASRESTTTPHSCQPRSATSASPIRLPALLSAIAQKDPATSTRTPHAPE